MPMPAACCSSGCKRAETGAISRVNMVVSEARFTRLGVRRPLEGSQVRETADRLHEVRVNGLLLQEQSVHIRMEAPFCLKKYMLSH